MNKTLTKIANDVRVEKVWDESDIGQGYWVVLKTGFADLCDDPLTPTHTIHELSLSILKNRMRDVRPCSCAECKPQNNACNNPAVCQTAPVG